jgi:hypothetical protein
MNARCHPIDAIRNPVTADIHSTVSGFPSIITAFARDRSARVNQRVSRISMAGNTKLSATPSSTRSTTSSQ